MCNVKLIVAISRVDSLFSFDNHKRLTQQESGDYKKIFLQSHNLLIHFLDCSLFFYFSIYSNCLEDCAFRYSTPNIMYLQVVIVLSVNFDVLFLTGRIQRVTIIFSIQPILVSFFQSFMRLTSPTKSFCLQEIRLKQPQCDGPSFTPTLSYPLATSVQNFDKNR